MNYCMKQISVLYSSFYSFTNEGMLLRLCNIYLDIFKNRFNANFDITTNFKQDTASEYKYFLNLGAYFNRTNGRIE